MPLTDEELAALRPPQAAAWIIDEAPVTLQGFGANFIGAVTRLLAVKEAAARADERDQMATQFDQLSTDFTNTIRRLTLTDAIVLVDDAVSLGEDPKAAIQRDRDAIPPAPPEIE